MTPAEDTLNIPSTITELSADVSPDGHVTLTRTTPKSSNSTWSLDEYRVTVPGSRLNLPADQNSLEFTISEDGIYALSVTAMWRNNEDGTVRASSSLVHVAIGEIDPMATSIEPMPKGFSSFSEGVTSDNALFLEWDSLTGNTSWILDHYRVFVSGSRSVDLPATQTRYTFKAPLPNIRYDVSIQAVWRNTITGAIAPGGRYSSFESWLEYEPFTPSVHPTPTPTPEPTATPTPEPKATPIPHLTPHSAESFPVRLPWNISLTLRSMAEKPWICTTSRKRRMML